MTEAPHPTSPIPSLPLPSATEHQRDRLAAIDAEIVSAIESGDASSMNELAWSRFELWWQCRADEDAGAAFRDCGLWDIGREESSFLNAGLITAELASFECTQEDAIKSLDKRFENESRHHIVPLTEFMSATYRSMLGVDRGIEQQAQVRAVEAELDAKRDEVSNTRTEMDQLIEFESQCETLRPLHEQLHTIIGPLARMMRVTQRGNISSEDRRKEMKVRELAQRVRVKIQESIPTFGTRKRFEELEREMIHAHLDVLEIEAKLQSALSALDVDCDAKALTEAMDKALRECQRVMRALLDTDKDELPQLVLDRAPRWTVTEIASKWDEFLEVVPRFAEASAAGAAPRVVVVPGRGDSYFDAKSGYIVCSLFPLESRMRSLDIALAQAYFSLDRDMRLSFSKVTRLEVDDTVRLCALFKKHFQEYRAQSSESDPFMKNWMRNQLEQRD